ncbi:MAG: glutamine-synthetase adenylyltransferase [Rhodobacteraceae bacterium]|nr:glutamine-synthetase adenylyltransferase [Paracoccaceae bacterium]
MTFADRITRLPRPFDGERAAETVAALPWVGGDLAALLSGAAGCSPYLARLAQVESDWLQEAVQGDPTAAVDAELASLDVPETATDVAGALHRAKRRIALFTALADLGGVWELHDVTGALTRLADRAVDLAIAAQLRPLLARGKLPGLGPDDLADRAGLSVLAMGKMGAFELNYSSDIDLICLFDDQRFEDDDLPEARSQFVRVVRKAMAMLSDITADGYVFRTDLRLRPDPSVTPVVVSMASAVRYYEGLGRAWERAAFIKARPCAGDLEAGARFLDEIKPFIWRRHLDYATVEDTHEIRKKIRLHKGVPGEDALDGRNLKLGQGGIREIEFFAQTRQLIAGGRDPALRVRGTCEAFRVLADKGWVGAETASHMTRDYTTLRTYEHRVQMVQDAQTHALPSGSEGWERLAAMMGQPDPEPLKRELGGIFQRVHASAEAFFTPSARQAAHEPELTPASEALIARWRSYPALRSERAQTIFARMRPDLLRRFECATDPEDAIRHFDSFLKGLPAGVQVLSLFDANPQLIDLMVDISSTAPALARYLARNSGVLDAVIGGSFFTPWPGRAVLEEDLRGLLSRQNGDYERELDAARRWMKDWHFRIGVHHLRGLVDGRETARHYTDLAEAAVAGIWTAVTADFASRHGEMPGRGATVVGMGSLGAARLSATSDLDLIVIFDADADDQSDGRRPLPAKTYYARLTKALVTALSAQTAEGALYEVDMRLRPSGKQGPVAAGWASFQVYQRKQAWTWEHLALTRARAIAGTPELRQEFEGFRKGFLAEPRDRAKTLGDLRDMRVRLAENKPKGGVWDVARGPGGLQDIELFAQAEALLAGAPATDVTGQLTVTPGLVGAADCDLLLEVHQLEAALKQASRLLVEGPLDPEQLGRGAQAFLLRETAAEDFAILSVRLQDLSETAGAVIDRGLSAAHAQAGAA